MLSPAFCWLCLEIQEEGGCGEEPLFPGSFPTWEAVASLSMLKFAHSPCMGLVSAVQILGGVQCRFWGDAARILGRTQCGFWGGHGADFGGVQHRFWGDAVQILMRDAVQILGCGQCRF